MKKTLSKLVISAFVLSIAPWVGMGTAAAASCDITASPGVGTPAQDAIDLATSGQTVCLNDGVYPEQVSISTPGITLQSVSAHGATIKAYDRLSRMTRFTLNGRRWVPMVDVTADDVVVRNLIIDGDKRVNHNGIYYVGVFVHGAHGVLIDDNEIKGFMHSTFKNSNRASGIAAYKQSSTEGTTVTISNNVITDWEKNGMAIGDAGTYADIIGNTVIGQGLAKESLKQAAQNAIQIGYGATGKIIGNTISDMDWLYEGIGNYDWAATGIMILFSDSVTIRDNTVLRTKNPLYHLISDDSVVEFNRFEPVPEDRGSVVIYSVTNSKITCNDFEKSSDDTSTFFSWNTTDTVYNSNNFESELSLIDSSLFDEPTTPVTDPNTWIANYWAPGGFTLSAFYDYQTDFDAAAYELRGGDPNPYPSDLAPASAPNDCTGQAKLNKEDSLPALQALLPTGNSKADKEINKAIKEIEKSLVIHVKKNGEIEDKHIEWLDDTHLACKHGDKVFKHEKKAVKHLKNTLEENKKQYLNDPGDRDVVSDVIASLVAADQILAMTAILEADPAAGGVDVDEAIKKLQKGLDKTRAEKKIGEFRKAWKKASGNCKEPKASCITKMEVTLVDENDNEFVVLKEGAEILHPETTFTSNGLSATFHTSCSRCLEVGDVDEDGEITLLEDDGKLEAKCDEEDDDDDEDDS